MRLGNGWQSWKRQPELWPWKKIIRQLNAALNELCLKQSEPLHEVHIKVEKEWIFEAHGQPLAISDLIRLEKDDLEAIRKEMDAIVGLQEVKDTLKSMEEHYKVTQLRQKQGLKAAPLSHHMIFTGNPERARRRWPAWSPGCLRPGLVVAGAADRGQPQ